MVELKIIEEELSKDTIKDKCDNAEVPSNRYIACEEPAKKGSSLKGRQIAISDQTIYALREDIRFFMVDSNALADAGEKPDAFLKLLWKLDLASISDVKFGLQQEATVELCVGGETEHILYFGDDFTREHFKRAFQSAQPDLDMWQSTVKDESDLKS